ncbi:hypothetical protein SDC9_78594 [bioreactor metagenome]|uniref:Uncharacterized protein n=1 Tax=bioreactor metagenome TaxID=1076179 RepID=A0A644YU36_9ZZZZ
MPGGFGIKVEGDGLAVRGHLPGLCGAGRDGRAAVAYVDKLVIELINHKGGLDNSAGGAVGVQAVPGGSDAVVYHHAGVIGGFRACGARGAGGGRWAGGCRAASAAGQHRAKQRGRQE